MKQKIFVLILTFLTLNSNIFAQEKSDKKNGFYRDTTSIGIVYERYYKNGMLSGVYRESDDEGNLLIFGEYKNGQRCGTWFFFENSGPLSFIFKDFSKNTYLITNEVTKEKYAPDYKCYSISYYPNGYIEDEGIILWPEGGAPESDCFIEYGEWKYYDDKGKLIKTKIFK